MPDVCPLNDDDAARPIGPEKGNGAMRNHSLTVFLLATTMILAASAFMLTYIP